MDGFFKKMFSNKNKDSGIKPGQFGGDDSANQVTPEQKERFRYSETLYEISDDKLQTLFPSRELQTAFHEMKASTMPPIAALNNKRSIVEEMKEKNLIDLEILKSKNTIYVGSGTDVEYPILLGARNITLVDIGFAESERMKKEIQDRVRKITPDFVTKKDDMLCQIDFGAGKEEVFISLNSQHYGPPVDENQKVERFVFPENVGLVIGFSSGGPVGRESSLLDSLQVGSYILDTEHLHQIDSHLDNEENVFIPLHTRTTEEIQNAYNKIGFRYIPSQHGILLQKIK